MQYQCLWREANILHLGPRGAFRVRECAGRAVQARGQLAQIGAIREQIQAEDSDARPRCQRECCLGGVHPALLHSTVGSIINTTFRHFLAVLLKYRSNGNITDLKKIISIFNEKLWLH